MASKKLIIVGGPNGAGKTTFINEYLREQPMIYLGADLIAEEINPDAPESAAIAAGREFLNRVNECLESDESFIVETTMSGKSFRRYIETGRNAGFDVAMLFVFPEDDDASVARVAERVRRGGHHVPEVDVRRRFSRSLNNFWNVYRHLADEWTLMYNSDSDNTRVAYYEQLQLVVQSEELLTRFWNLAGIDK